MLNWAGNIRYAADIVDEPTSVEEVQRLVKQGTRLKALGTRHAFNGIGDSVHRLLVMTGLNRVVALDAERHRVTVEGGSPTGSSLDISASKVSPSTISPRCHTSPSRAPVPRRHMGRVSPTATSLPRCSGWRW
jgi:hypothetical protein